MISSLSIDGYRGFDHFQMTNLGRVNLLVGSNNSGKTSVLEALYLLASHGDPAALERVLSRRGEHVFGDRNLPNRPELEICRLFSGYDLQAGSGIEITARNTAQTQSIKFRVRSVDSGDRESLGDAQGASRFVLSIRCSTSRSSTVIPLTSRGTIASDAASSLRAPKKPGEKGNVQYVATDSLTSEELVALWDRIALTSQESLVLQALRFLEPKIERIAAQARGPAALSRGGFIVKRSDHDDPIPIGTLGDGMWRMLAMAIATTQSRDGMLLVDEIDTGLHYTVMADMWRLIYMAAKEFDVQVFATTHSFDCVHSLAEICGGEYDPNHRITLQRLEIGKPRAVPYTEAEIKVAAERNIEVR